MTFKSSFGVEFRSAPTKSLSSRKSLKLYERKKTKIPAIAIQHCDTSPYSLSAAIRLYLEREIPISS